MTKEQLADELRELIDRSGMSVTLTVAIREGDERYCKMLKAGSDPPSPAQVDSAVCITFPADFTPPPVVVNGVTLAEWENVK